MSQNDDATQPVVADRVFTDIAIVHPDRNETDHGMSLAVKDGRILAIAASGDEGLPDAVDVIEASGLYVVPGLADMHTHPMADADLNVFLANGITAIRAMWGEPSLLAMRERVRRNEIAGPNIVTAGPIISGNPPIHFGTDVIDDAADADALVREQKALGYDFLKVYARIEPDVFDALIDAAAAHDMPLAGHVPNKVDLFHAAASGMQTTEHLFGYMAAISADPDSMPMGLFDQRPEAAEMFEKLGRGEISIERLIDPEKERMLIETLVENRTWTVPTSIVLEGFMGATQYDPQKLDYLPEAVSQFWSGSELIRDGMFSSDRLEGARLYNAYQYELIDKIDEAGGLILAGTDAPNPGVLPGFGLVDEIELLSEAGLGNAGALAAATTEAGRFLEDEFGLETGSLGIAEGGVADFVILSGNPLDDLNTLRDPVGVHAGGSWFDTQSLENLLLQTKRHFADKARRFDGMPSLKIGPNFPVLKAFDDRSREAVLGFVADPDGKQFLKQVLRTEDGRLVEYDLDLGPSGSLTIDGVEFTLSTPTGQADLFLTKTLMDAASLRSVVTDLDVNETVTMKARLCAESVCDDDLTPYRITRSEDDAVEGFFYYTGARVYELTPLDGIGGPQTIRIGGGFYQGQPVQVVTNDAKWERQL
ncbi:MAG: hypothetical protein AAF311_08205 [Pseudomonadota bacterium]